jgi:outer membrane biosynthesis protein TonB
MGALGCATRAGVIASLSCFGCLTPPAVAPKNVETVPAQRALETPPAAPPEVSGAASTPSPPVAEAPAPAPADAANASCGRSMEAPPEAASGSHPPAMARWLPAIEGYTSCVNLANQVAIAHAAADFARYINQIHNRVHPLFSGSYLPFLEKTPGEASRLDNEAKTTIELVLGGKDGSIVSMGVIRSSGVTSFDVSALDSVSRAAPFGAPLATILSSDGNLYLQWQFWRNPLFACSTYFARPYKLSAVSLRPAP